MSKDVLTVEQRRATNTRSVRLRVTIISLNRPCVTSGNVVSASSTRGGLSPLRTMAKE